jgi:hypothetical protein
MAGNADFYAEMSIDRRLASSLKFGTISNRFCFIKEYICSPMVMCEPRAPVTKGAL